MSPADLLGSSDAPTLASSIPPGASISPELESGRQMARLQLCSSSFWSQGLSFRFVLKSHPFKKYITDGLRVLKVLKVPALKSHGVQLWIDCLPSRFNSFIFPQGAVFCYCHFSGCSTVMNTGDGGEHFNDIMIVPYQIVTLCMTCWLLMQK